MIPAVFTHLPSLSPAHLHSTVAAGLLCPPVKTLSTFSSPMVFLSALSLQTAASPWEIGLMKSDKHCRAGSRADDLCLTEPRNAGLCRAQPLALTLVESVSAVSAVTNRTVAPARRAS